MRSCIGVVLGGLTTRAGVGVGGMEEAIGALEEVHAQGVTSYRFALREGEIHVQVGQPTGVTAQGEEPAAWRTLMELVS